MCLRTDLETWSD
uniref:Uncharacterized protein n=1 Tax=Rhizophora mucronata TaxID=61149 RepID=A0A2P2NS26_RHIMU